MVPAAVLLSFAILAIIVARQVRRYHALKDFGGHWSAGWSRLWLLKTQSSGRMNKIFTDINKEYGMGNFFPHFPPHVLLCNFLLWSSAGGTGATGIDLSMRLHKLPTVPHIHWATPVL